MVTSLRNPIMINDKDQLEEETGELKETTNQVF